LKELILVVANEENAKRPDLKLLTPNVLPWTKETEDLGPRQMTTWDKMEERAMQQVLLRVMIRDDDMQDFRDGKSQRYKFTSRKCLYCVTERGALQAEYDYVDEFMKDCEDLEDLSFWREITIKYKALAYEK
jgi:hypothetical protein